MAAPPVAPLVAAALAVALLVAAIVELVVSTGRCANEDEADTGGAGLDHCDGAGVSGRIASLVADRATSGLRQAVGAEVRGGVNTGAGCAVVANELAVTCVGVVTCVGTAAAAVDVGAPLLVAVDHDASGTLEGRDRTEATVVGIVVRVVIVVGGGLPRVVCVENAGILLLVWAGGATATADVCDEPRIGAVGGRLDRLCRGSTRRTGASTRGGAVLTIRGPEAAGPPGAWIDAELGARGVDVASAGAWRPASR